MSSRIEIFDRILTKALVKAEKQVFERGRIDQKCIEFLKTISEIERNLKDVRSKDLPTDDEARKLTDAELIDKAKSIK